MVTRIKRLLTFANVMSVLAVFIALGGSAYAFKLGKNSVGTKQIKGSAVTAAKIKKDAVNGSKIRDSSVNGADLANGAVGSTKIANGAVLSAALASASVVGSKLGLVDTHVIATPLPDNGTLARAVATCDPGETLIGGGANTAAFGEDILIEGNRPSKPDASEVANGEAFSSWETSAINKAGAPTGATSVRSWAVCLR
jgi:hypothetical protein